MCKGGAFHFSPFPPFQSSLWLPLALAGGSFCVGWSAQGRLASYCHDKTSSEAITLGGGKAKLADVRSNGEERFTLAKRPPFYCRRLIPETRLRVPLHTTSSIPGGSTLQGVSPGLQEAKRRRACAERTDVCNLNCSRSAFLMPQC